MDMVDVSTVFLGLDYQFGDGPPLIFETMAFWRQSGGGEKMRCSTWLQAEAQHAAMIRAVTSPRAVWDYCVRSWKDHWRRAAAAWTGKPDYPPGLEAMGERLEQAKEDHW